MRLTVADLDADNDLESYQVPLFPGFDDNTASILYVPLPTTLRIRGIDDLVAGLPSWAVRNHLTVVAAHPQTIPHLDEDALDDISRRVAGSPLFLLSHDLTTGEPVLRHVRGPAIDLLDESILLEELRKADVQSVLHSPGALLPGTSRLHYEGPNRHHYGAFLRPGFALTTNNKLDRMAFWLLRHMRDRSNIVVDHWSMIALAHHACAYAARALKTTSEPFIESLRGYETIETLAPRLRRAFPAETDGAALFLLSINSSGSMAHDVVLPSLEQAMQRKAAAVALASASSDGDREVDSLIQLDATFRRQLADACVYCDDGLILVPIDKTTYLLKLAAYTEQTAIRMTDTTKTTSVVSDYAGIGAFSLHRDYNEAGDDRHHAFYVDVRPMLDTEHFQRRLRSCVDGLTGIRPSVLLCPPSEAANELALRVAAMLEVSTLVVSDERGLSSRPEAELAALCGASDILVVDDVVITGRRIEGFRQELIQLRRRLGHPGDFKLGCLVGVARARDERALQGCRDFVHHFKGDNQTFAAVETLHLPNWDERECPWCRELRSLERLSQEIKSIPMVHGRIQALRRTGGLHEPFFPSGPQDAAAESPLGAPADELAWRKLSGTQDATSRYADLYWELNPGSVFGNLQGVDLVISVAAAVHGLRSKVGPDGIAREPRLDRRFRAPISKVLDPHLYLFGRFYEPVLLASILRVCNDWDLRSPDVEDDLEAAMQRHLSYLSSGERLLGEALILGRLGRVPAGAVKSLATQHGGELQRLADALL